MTENFLFDFEKGVIIDLETGTTFTGPNELLPRKVWDDFVEAGEKWSIFVEKLEAIL